MWAWVPSIRSFIGDWETFGTGDYRGWWRLRVTSLFCLLWFETLRTGASLQLRPRVRWPLQFNPVS